MVKLTEYSGIQTVWEPRHKGTDGSEIGGEVARQSYTHPKTLRQSTLCASTKVARGLARDWTNRQAEEHCQSICGHRQFTAFLIDPLLKQVWNCSI
jgi:hypothetical protein